MFVAINFISCPEDYKARFEQLFADRVRAIDTMPGFVEMEVLRQKDGEGPYLVLSHWESEEQFREWVKSPAFIEGHRRAFADMEKAKAEWGLPPMTSEFKTYERIAQ